MYLPSDPRLEWSGEGPLFELNLNKCWGQNVGTVQVTPGPLFMSSLRPWPGKAPVYPPISWSISHTTLFYVSN